MNIGMAGEGRAFLSQDTAPTEPLCANAFSWPKIYWSHIHICGAGSAFREDSAIDPYGPRLAGDSGRNPLPETLGERRMNRTCTHEWDPHWIIGHVQFVRSTQERNPLRGRFYTNWEWESTLSFRLRESDVRRTRSEVLDLMAWKA